MCAKCSLSSSFTVQPTYNAVASGPRANTGDVRIHGREQPRKVIMRLHARIVMTTNTFMAQARHRYVLATRAVNTGLAVSITR